MKKVLQKLIRTDFGQWFIALLGSFFIRLIYWTNRWEYIGKDIIEATIRDGKPALFCFWHGRMAMMPYAWKWKNPFHMLLSHHTDGKLIARVIGNFGISSIYGSTQRKGEQASRDILDVLAKGHYVGVTPDGPRGPAYVVSPGIVKLAKLAGVPIIPSTYATRRRRFLRTWDRFHIPLPLGRGIVIVGEPIYVQGDLEETRQQLEKALVALTQRADALCQLPRPTDSV